MISCWPRIGRKVAKASLGLAFITVLTACSGTARDTTTDRMSFLSDGGELPNMRWDHRKESDQWTTEALKAVADKDRQLSNRVPSDIAKWCPGYKTASLDDRRAFWVGLMSALAKHESTWNPRASGGGGRYIGLMQISPATARQHGCEAKSVAALKNGADNLTCAVEIFSSQVAKDGVVAGTGNRGVGRDWGPFRKASKRREMAAWTSRQPFCTAG